ncbi:MAG TPA: Fis family transcriptional regulator, partial [Pseudonocardiaceae bacterium]|nr:Fis family transcriptional regulator [Pseudonocardiaceae bacterium]
AANHLAHCPFCAEEMSVQRQARAAVRTAETPCVPAGLLASLRNIPTDTDLPSGPEQLAMTEDGQLVTVQRTRQPRRPDRSPAPLGAGPVLGSSEPLGSGSAVLATGNRSWHGRRAVQGAGVVAAGLVLGALAMVGPHLLGSPGDTGNDPTHGDGSVTGGTAGDQFVQANYATLVGNGRPSVVPSTSVLPTPVLAPSFAPSSFAAVPSMPPSMLPSVLPAVGHRAR